MLLVSGLSNLKDI